MAGWKGVRTVEEGKGRGKMEGCWWMVGTMEGGKDAGGREGKGKDKLQHSD